MNVKRLFVILAAIAAFTFSSSMLTAQPVIQQEITSNGFTFELVEAEPRGNHLEVVILVTANEQDRWLSVYRYRMNTRNSRIIDDFGQVYYPDWVELAGERTEGQSTQGILTEGIRTRLVLRFDLQGQIPDSLQLVEIGARFDDHEHFRVSFKGVQVGD